jgi:hypothetical protein
MIRADLAAIEPEDAEQEARRNHWLAQVDKLTAPELAAYLIHRELSKPTLSNQDKKPSKPQELVSEDPHDSVSFRFGQDELQEGWYDNSFEIRTNQGGLVVSAVRKILIVRTLRRYAQYYEFTH